MVSHHLAKSAGHVQSGSGDLVFLVVEEQDFTCLLKSAITLITKAHGMKPHGRPL